MAEPRALRRGHRGDRLVLGIALILGGGLGLQGTSPYILWLLPIGAVLHAAGWAILPADGWRRIVAGSASSIAVLLLLTGPQALWMLSLPYAGWLLVRRRPALAWTTLALPIASGFALALITREYEQLPWALPIQLAVLVGAAWLAALFAHSAARRSGATAASSSAPG
jgi:hypothetical protein